MTRSIKLAFCTKIFVQTTHVLPENLHLLASKVVPRYLR